MDSKSFAHVEIKDADRGQVAAVFSTLNVVDSDGDVTLPGAFEDGAPVRISAYGHASWSGALPVGKGTIREVGDEAVLEGQFFLDTSAGRDTFEVVKGLADMQEWSYGYDVVESEPGKHDGRDVRLLKRLKVHEVSPVLLGAGVNTRTLAVKADMKFSEHAQAVVADVGELIDRAAEVMALRASKGKSISPASVELLEELDTHLSRLKTVLTPEPDTEPDDDIVREYARFVALTQGVA